MNSFIQGRITGTEKRAPVAIDSTGRLITNAAAGTDSSNPILLPLTGITWDMFESGKTYVYTGNANTFPIVNSAKTGITVINEGSGAFLLKDISNTYGVAIESGSTQTFTTSLVGGLYGFNSNGASPTPGTLVAATIRSSAMQASMILKGFSGKLVSLSVFNSKATAQYILIMDSGSVPADGAVTLLYPPILIAANDTRMVNFTRPLAAANGISVCNSSTGSFTKTIGSADCIFVAQIQ